MSLGCQDLLPHLESQDGPGSPAPETLQLLRLVAFHWPDLLEAFRNKQVTPMETRTARDEMLMIIAEAVEPIDDPDADYRLYGYIPMIETWVRQRIPDQSNHPRKMVRNSSGCCGKNDPNKLITQSRVDCSSYPDQYIYSLFCFHQGFCGFDLDPVTKWWP